MRKLFFAAFAVLAFASVSAQGQFKAGISGALPIGDAGDLSTFGVVVEAAYLFEVSESFHAGPTAGIGHYFGDEIAGFEIDDATFLPIGAAGRFGVSEDFTLGADLGYGIGIAPDGNDGGFYYSPRAQYSVSESIDIVLAYRGVSLDGGSWDSISLGVEFGL